MSLSTSQLSDIVTFQSELKALVNRRIELVSSIAALAFPARAELREVVCRLEETQQRFEVAGKRYEGTFRAFMAQMVDPGKLEDERLEMIASWIVDMDKGFIREAEEVRGMIASSAPLDSVRHLLFALVAAGPDVMLRLRKCMRQSVENDRLILERAQRWQDEMLAMKLLVELGKRRPLTTGEKIQLTQVSVIHAPVIQEPSDSRSDWYDDDGR